MGRRSTTGQVFFIMLIIILAAIALFVILPAQIARQHSSPEVQKVLWQVNGQNVTSVFKGDEIMAIIIVRTNENYAGSIVVKIRKDVSLWFDSDYMVETFPVDALSGETVKLELSFLPDEVSHDRFRGYFVEVDFTALGTSWSMEDTYPPRLQVSDVQSGPETPA